MPTVEELTKQMRIKPTKAHAVKMLSVLKCGLVTGVGQPKPGETCILGVKRMIFGLSHGDGLEGGLPVGAAVRSFDISLNDCKGWSSPAARANGMARLSVAEFGSDEVDQNQFVKELALAVIRKIVPLALRAAASVHGEGKHKATLEQHAKTLEGQGDDLDAARAASDAARAARAASDAARAASDAASDAARYAARAAARAARAARAAARAARAASDAARAASAAARAAASAAASDAARAKAQDEVLTLVAECAVEALQKCGSYGCRWLSLVKDV